MLASKQCGGVFIAAALVALSGAAQAQDVGERAQAAPKVEFAAPPMYAAAPPQVSAADAMGAEPVLVPLPPGVWAAASGLVGLAVLAVWRKHRLREE